MYPTALLTTCTIQYYLVLWVALESEEVEECI